MLKVIVVGEVREELFNWCQRRKQHCDIEQHLKASLIDKYILDPVLTTTRQEGIVVLNVNILIINEGKRESALITSWIQDETHKAPWKF